MYNSKLDVCTLYMQAKRFVRSWEAGMEAVAQKSEELQQMSAVGADIDSVKCQLEEHKVYICRTMQQLLVYSVVTATYSLYMHLYHDRNSPRVLVN